MRIAVATTNGREVNEHFGRVGLFYIYDLEAGTARFVETRSSEPLSENDPEHPFDPEKFSRIVKVIADCKKLYVSRIGERPAEELKKAGIEPLVCHGPISEIS